MSESEPLAGNVNLRLMRGSHRNSGGSGEGVRGMRQLAGSVAAGVREGHVGKRERGSGSGVGRGHVDRFELRK